ncbi:hypothetical protein GO013_00060 [Pseudodesulfovibrio sp. JC047]|uniref:hypothetical protein n=1 Tax=Pseudodesulfovibrio sp. JC047 TaxID=2683199 RepID=UPI0013D62756|nr:hypothetical protein [Pseudodesulfovibrio sp. JC047]NDV17811.1 hypothetical protein [Pseudodesulfovibrio sp. JC047]
MNKISEAQVKHIISNGVIVDVIFTPAENGKDKYISVVRVNDRDNILHTQKDHIRKFTAKAAINWSLEMKTGTHIVFDVDYNHSLTDQFNKIDIS